MYSNNPNHTKDPRLLVELLNFVKNIEGAVVEVGVYKAEKYLLFVDIAAQQGKTAIAVDSFCGFAEPSNYDICYPKGNLDVGGADWLREKIANKENAIIYEGFIPEVLQDVIVNCISFIHIDVDQYMPTKQSIEWAWPLISIGGIMICHDYLPNDERNCSRAIDEFTNTTHSKYNGLKNTWIWWIKK